MPLQRIFWIVRFGRFHDQISRFFMSIRGFWGFVVTTLVITRESILLSRAVARVRKSTNQLAGIFCPISKRHSALHPTSNEMGLSYLESRYPTHILLSRAVARVRRSTSQLAGIFVQSTSDIHPGRLIGWVVCCNPITLGEEASPDAGLFSGGRRAVAIPSLREK